MPFGGTTLRMRGTLAKAMIPHGTRKEKAESTSCFDDG
jgi:hypothetical protein